MKKILGIRFGCILIGLAVIFTGASVSGAASKSAVKASVANKKMILTAGSKRTITIKNRKSKLKYKYSSNKKNIAAVNKRGKVTAKKKGKALITVKEVNTSGKVRVLGKVTVVVKAKIKKSSDNVISTTPAGEASPSVSAVLDKSATPSNTPASAPSKETIAPTTATPEHAATPEPTMAPTPLPTLEPFSTMVEVSKLSEQKTLPDVMKFMDGSEVTKENWNVRAAEIRDMYQYYMYGIWRNGDGETLNYEITPGDDVQGGTSYNLKMNIETSGSEEGQKAGASASFNATVCVPSGTAPENGWPTFIMMGSLTDQTKALENGCAVISYDTAQVSADSAAHSGAFYTLYPYGKDWKEQTGVLMAWAWGTSKIVDALYAGAGDELSIDETYTIAGGVSRWGKATAVAGAFDTRLRIALPTCSGCGGQAVFRYNPNAEVTQEYDVSSLGYQSTVKYSKGDIETLGSIQSSGESFWFNDRFLQFRSIYQLPFDQHFLSTLYAEEGRTLMMIGGFCYDVWQNTPSLWYNFQKSHGVFEMLGLGNNQIISLHDVEMGHNIISYDLDVLFKYCDEMYNGKDVENFDISELHTSLFELETTPAGINNKEVYEAMIPE